MSCLGFNSIVLPKDPHGCSNRVDMRTRWSNLLKWKTTWSATFYAEFVGGQTARSRWAALRARASRHFRICETLVVVVFFFGDIFFGRRWALSEPSAMNETLPQHTVGCLQLPASSLLVVPSEIEPTRVSSLASLGSRRLFDCERRRVTAGSQFSFLRT